MITIVKTAWSIIDRAAGRRFVSEIRLSEYIEEAVFEGPAIRIEARGYSSGNGLHAAGVLVNRFRNLLLKQCFTYNQEWVDVYWAPGKNPFVVKPERKKMTEQQTIITTPGVVTSELDVSRSVLDKLVYFVENPETKGGLIRLPDERQVAMSKASADLVVGCTLEQAVKRRRCQYVHPVDLMMARIKQYELFHALKYEEIKPGDTIREVRFRVISLDGSRNTRYMTYLFENFIDENGIFYEWGRVQGVEPDRETPPEQWTMAYQN